MTAPGVLFKVASRGSAVSVGHATEAELARLAGTVAPADARDQLDAWSLIALRDVAGGGTEIHALGWRTGVLNTWITSPLVIVDRGANVVSTTSGHAYSLGRPTPGSCIRRCAGTSPMPCRHGDTMSRNEGDGPRKS
jgi:hypothetical protein